MRGVSSRDDARTVKPHKLRQERFATVSAGMVALSVLFGCSGSDSGSDKKTGEPAEACNALVDDGPTVVVSLLTKPAPSGIGGELLDGTYELTSATLYDESGGATPMTKLSAVYVFEGGVVQQVGHTDGVEERYTSTYTTSGTTISTTDTCPKPDSGTYGFSATPEDFRIYVAGTGSTLGEIFRKR